MKNKATIMQRDKSILVIRVIAMMMIVLYHCLCIYTTYKTMSMDSDILPMSLG